MSKIDTKDLCERLGGVIMEIDRMVNTFDHADANTKYVCKCEWCQVVIPNIQYVMDRINGGTGYPEPPMP